MWETNHEFVQSNECEAARIYRDECAKAPGRVARGRTALDAALAGHFRGERFRHAEALETLNRAFRIVSLIVDEVPGG